MSSALRSASVFRRSGLLAANRCSGEGTITYTGMMTRMGVWKYRAKIPGLTQDTGDSFYEWELTA